MVTREEPRRTRATPPTTTKSTPAARRTSRSRWTSVTPRVFEEPRHVLHPPKTFRRRPADILGNQGPVDAGIDKLKDALIPAQVDGRIGRGHRGYYNGLHGVSCVAFERGTDHGGVGLQHATLRSRHARKPRRVPETAGCPRRGDQAPGRR